MSDDNAQMEELHDLRRQLAEALQRITEQQHVIDGLGRRLERSLSAGSGEPGPAAGTAAASVTNERDRTSATAMTVATGTTGEPTTLSLRHDNVFTPERHRVLVPSLPKLLLNQCRQLDLLCSRLMT